MRPLARAPEAGRRGHEADRGGARAPRDAGGAQLAGPDDAGQALEAVRAEAVDAQSLE